MLLLPGLPCFVVWWGVYLPWTGEPCKQSLWGCIAEIGAAVFSGSAAIRGEGLCDI